MTQTIYGSLKGKTVLITGGASGIGASIAGVVPRPGRQGRHARLRCRGRAGLGEGLGERLHFEHCDVRDIPALQAAIRRVSEALGPITVLVNNAARDDRHTIDQVTPEYWDERFAINLDHQFFAAQAVLPDMEQAGGGSIINFGSTSYMVSDDSFAAYKTAKSAVGRPHPGACARSRAAQHPRQLPRAGLDHDPAPDRSLADPGQRGRTDAPPMRQAPARARRISPTLRSSSPPTSPAPCRRRPISWTAAGFNRRLGDRTSSI